MDFQSIVIAKLDAIDDKISDLCTRTAVTETKVEEIITTRLEKSQSTYRTITIIFAVITAVSTLKAIFWS